jgi:hypothetical protein
LGSQGQRDYPPGPSLWAISDWFLFQVSDFPGRSMARGRYPRHREYPQPPPPTKNNTKITINKVSIVLLYLAFYS